MQACGVGRRPQLPNPRHTRQTPTNTRVGSPSQVFAAWAYLPVTTSPPASVHSLADLALTQPWPLQLFWPLQELLAVAHSLVPLQLLVPEHFTFASAACTVLVASRPVENRAAAAVAMATP